jgi:tetratricopeptide (TPR) repeat protein
MWSLSRSSRSVLAAAIVSGLWPAAVAACGPGLPNWLLRPEYGPLGVAAADPLAAPVADFHAEIGRLELPKVAFRAVMPKRDEGPYRQSMDADITDLSEAMDRQGVSEPQRKASVARLREIRQHLGEFLTDREDRRRNPPGEGQQKAPLPPLEGVPEPDGLPAEFAAYLNGLTAYHSGRVDLARQIWQGLLAMPPERRRFRSVWASYMLGRSYVDTDPQQAIPHFERVRQLAREGYADRIGLAASSYGWQARACLNMKRYEEAIDLYLAQLATGDISARNSLRLTAEKVLLADPSALPRVARHQPSQTLLTAYLLSRGGPSISNPAMVTDKMFRQWLEAMERSGEKVKVGADRLGWIAYQAGEMEAAGRWLALAPDSSAIACWLKAKLLMREGKIDKAAPLLARVSQAFPEDQSACIEPQECPDDDRMPAERARGELALLHLARRNYTEALDALHRSDYWVDAAYLAERVLTVDELIAYVDANWPETQGKGSVHEKAEEVDADALESKAIRRAARIRYLLGRRLVRAGRWQQSLKYCPPEIRPRIEEYGRLLDTANRPKAVQSDRAKAYWQAAKIARHDGMGLLGTETSPDWFACGGEFDLGSVQEELKDRSKVEVAGLTGDERRRVAANPVTPEKRYHYRYVGAEYAWQAALLMPDESEETAVVLATAGSWLKNIDRKEADRFYKALVNRCRSTRLGREADRLHWFPSLDSRPAELR